MHGELDNEVLRRKNPSLHKQDYAPLSFVWLFNGHDSHRWLLLTVDLKVPIAHA